MKKLVAILFLAASTICVAQESVKLRLKYAKGDAYNVEISQNVSSPQMVMDMKMTSRLDVTEVDGDVYSSEKKITKIVMDIMQGLNAMSYDSSKSDEDLDEMGMMLKSQMNAVIC